MEKIRVKLTVLEDKNKRRGKSQGASHQSALMEFHINREVRREYGLKHSLFALTGNVILADMRQTRELAAKFNAKQSRTGDKNYIRTVPAEAGVYGRKSCPGIPGRHRRGG